MRQRESSHLESGPGSRVRSPDLGALHLNQIKMLFLKLIFEILMSGLSTVEIIVMRCTNGVASSSKLVASLT